MRTGQAGEYLAAAVLQRHFPAIAFPNIPTAYDLMAETKDGQFLRCQVKTCEKPNEIRGFSYWRFQTTKRKTMYTDKEIDFFALVVLPKRLVVFMRPEDVVSQTQRFKTDEVNEDLELISLERTLGAWL